MAIESLRDVARAGVSAFSAGGGSFTESGTAPGSPSYGDRWLDTTTGIQYTWVDPGIWVDLSEPSAADVADAIHGATSKTNPVDADELGVSDSADSWLLKKLTFANLKTWIASFFVSKSGATMTGALEVPASASGAQVPQAQEVALLASTQLSGLRNKLVNSNFIINQRGVSGTVTLAAGAYGHDGWKGGASGCTYTFSTTAGVTTLTISAGSLIQVVLGGDVHGGTNVLSWTGTAQGKIGAGSYGATGITGSLTGGSNVSIEFNTGTLSIPQLEPGGVKTPYALAPVSDEIRCFKRAYVESTSVSAQVYSSFGYALSSTQMRFLMKFPFDMISAPTFSVLNGAASDYQVVAAGSAIAVTALAGNVTTTKTAGFDATVASGLTAGHAGILRSASTTVTRILWSSEP